MSDYIRELRAKTGRMLLEMPSVTIAALDRDRRVLLVRIIGNGKWVLPGGAVEPEETPADAAVREIWEEAGIAVRLVRVACVCGGPDFVVRYANGDETSYLMVVFEAEPLSNEPRADGVETSDARWVTREEALTLDLGRWVPEVLERVYASGEAARFRPPTWRPPGVD